MLHKLFILVALCLPLLSACGVKGSLKRPDAEVVKEKTLPDEKKSVPQDNPDVNPHHQLEELRQYRP